MCVWRYTRLTFLYVFYIYVTYVIAIIHYECCGWSDRPSKPEGPLEVKDVFKDRCRLKWNPPKDDGGVEIDHYVVEAMDTATGA